MGRAPDVSDDTVRRGTGRGWEEWIALLDGAGTRQHTALARWLVAEHGVDAWWAQTVVVGYERIRGIRGRHQMADGTYTAARTKTVQVDPALLRELLLDEQGRALLFPGITTELRSRPGSKNVRMAFEQGSVEISMTPSGARTRIAVAHTKLAEASDVEVWKSFWGEWLDALDEPPTA